MLDTRKKDEDREDPYICRLFRLVRREEKHTNIILLCHPKKGLMLWVLC